MRCESKRRLVTKEERGEVEERWGLGSMAYRARRVDAEVTKRPRCNERGGGVTRGRWSDLRCEYPSSYLRQKMREMGGERWRWQWWRWRRWWCREETRSQATSYNLLP